MKHLGVFVWCLAVAAAADARGQQPKPDQRPLKLPDSVILEADIEYGRAGERSLKLDLLRPKDQGDKLLPVVVQIHGGGWRNGSKEGGRRMLASYVASGNYIGVTIGYRLTGEAIWPAQIHDCKAAIRWIRANADKYHIDARHVGLVGNSAGGHLVALLGTSGDVAELEGNNGNPGYSSRVQCVVDLCGPSDFLRFNDQKGHGGQSAVAELFGGPPSEHEAAAKAASPVTWASADDPPFLVAHGTQDPTVPPAQAETMVAALQKVGVPVVFIRMEGFAHSLASPALAERQRQFFERNLRDQAVEVSTAPIQGESPKK